MDNITSPRRRGGQPYNPAKDTAPVHDRRAKEIGVKVMVAPMLVPNPLATADQPNEQIVVVRNLRDDPLAERHARGIISDVQCLAGRRYQADFYLAGENSLKAIDFSRDAVDGGLPPEPLPDSRLKATEGLGKAHDVLGREGTSIVQDVLIGGYSLAIVAARRGVVGKGFENYFGKRFIECLNCLTKVYGLANRIPPAEKVEGCV